MILGGSKVLNRYLDHRTAMADGWSLAGKMSDLPVGRLALVEMNGAMRLGRVASNGRTRVGVSVTDSSGLTTVKSVFPDQIWVGDMENQEVRFGTPEVLLDVWVSGTPRPKGSLKPIGRRGGRVMLVEQSTESKAWRKKVTECAVRSLGLPVIGYPTLLPVILECEFVFKRAEKCEDIAPIGANIADLDKAIRNIGDALQDAGVILNDSQIVQHVADKRWAADGFGPGVLIRVVEKV